MSPYHRALSWLDRFSTEEPWLEVARLYRIGLLSWFMLHTLLLLPYHAQIWSPEAYHYTPPFDFSSIAHGISHLSTHAALAPYYLGFVFAQLLFLLLALVSSHPGRYLPAAWFFTMNVNARAGITLDGGNNLSELLLFYLMFLNTSGRKIPATAPFAGARIAASNTALMVSRFQVFVVYLCVGWFKLNGGLWQNGMALYYILQSQEYSHPWIAKFIVEEPWISLVGTYFTVCFQAAFPFLVWPTRTRPWLLLAGLGLHLGIAFVMGLFTFGLIMCVSYLVFFKESWSREVLLLKNNFLKRKNPGAFGSLLRFKRGKPNHGAVLNYFRR